VDVIDTTSRLQVTDSPAGSEDRFRALIEKSPEAITLLSADGTVLYVSPSTSRMTGYECDELVGRSGFDFLHPDDLARAKDLHADLLQKPGRHIKAEVRLHHKDGSWRWVEAIGTNLLGAPQVNAIVASYHDVTERKRMEEALKAANDKLAFWARELEWRNRELSLLSEMGGLLQACVTEKEAYHVIARSAPELFPQGSGAVYIVDRSKDLAEALAVWGKNSTGELVFPRNDCWALRRGRVHAVEGTDMSLFCQHLRRRPPAASLCVPMVAQGEILGVLHLHFAAHDGRLADHHRHRANTVADHLSLALGNLRLRERLRTQSIRDPLTGLYNRRYMEESLDREVRRAGRRNTPVAVTMLDLDHFKSVNDTFGHEAGDAALISLGAFLQARVRQEDIACRYGGEEFVIILPDASLDGARKWAERTRQAARDLQISHRLKALRKVTLSLGLAMFPDHGSTGESLLRAADRALYRAKQNGRDRVELASGPV
jgi:diguanylate cyclase (GGDEF)-like protein/PAS domain S-box-containing protein